MACLEKHTFQIQNRRAPIRICTYRFGGLGARAGCLRPLSSHAASTLLCDGPTLEWRRRYCAADARPSTRSVARRSIKREPPADCWAYAQLTKRIRTSAPDRLSLGCYPDVPIESAWARVHAARQLPTLGVIPPEIETIEVHHFGPRGDEVGHELRVAVLRAIDLRNCTQL